MLYMAQLHAYRNTLRIEFSAIPMFVRSDMSRDHAVTAGGKKKTFWRPVVRRVWFVSFVCTMPSPVCDEKYVRFCAKMNCENSILNSRFENTSDKRSLSTYVYQRIQSTRSSLTDVWKCVNSEVLMRRFSFWQPFYNAKDKASNKNMPLCCEACCCARSQKLKRPCKCSPGNRIYNVIA